MSPNQPIRRPQRPIDPSQLRPQRRVFDIAPPGRTPASSTSRPIVTGHKVVTDPSVTMHGANKMFGQRPPVSQSAGNPASFDIAPPAAVSRPAAAPAHRVAPVITPLHTDVTPAAAQAVPVRRPLPQPAAPLPLSPPRPPQPVASPRPMAPSSQAVGPAVMQPPRAPASMSAAYPRPGDSHDEVPANLGPMHINEDPVLISKHIPKDGKKWRWIITASIVFFFLLVIFDILLDADFITLKQVPHTHFF